jgi:hypothetical protein
MAPERAQFPKMVRINENTARPVVLVRNEIDQLPRRVAVKNPFRPDMQIAVTFPVCHFEM